LKQLTRRSRKEYNLEELKRAFPKKIIVPAKALSGAVGLIIIFLLMLIFLVVVVAIRQR